MNALIAAFVLPLLLGRFFSFLAFVIVWLFGIAVYAVWLWPQGSSTPQNLVMIVAAGVVAQVGYFANIVVRSMLGSRDKDPTAR